LRRVWTEVTEREPRCCECDRQVEEGSRSGSGVGCVEKLCWRCKVDIPMLDESEWEYVRPREWAEDQEAFRRAALDRYFELTGFRATNIAALFHHRLALYGPPCHRCGKPLRTPRAR
jgi:hypothetical protein